MRSVAIALTFATFAAVVIDAHKPVTSKYTYTEDVYPIVKEHCGGCHVTGGIAPMSLMTYDEARPWAESIRLELTSGHMPPWYGDQSVAPLRDVHTLSPRDLDVVLTWASGGTPQGSLTKTSGATPRRTWAKGRPDLAIQLPMPVQLPAEKSDDTREFVLREANDRDRTIAFADLLPGNPAIVHDATIFIRPQGSDQPSAVISTWIPGETPLAPVAGFGFLWRAGEQLVVRIHYRKNWKLENKPASDRSTVGVYFAKGSLGATSRAIRAVALSPGHTTLIEAAMQALAVRASATPSDVRVRVDAIRPDGSRTPVAAFVTRAGWDQRYWLARPLDLPKGSRLEVSTVVTTGAGRLEPIRLWLDAAS
jgi:mono/diheme cytochrome c family protein